VEGDEDAVTVSAPEIVLVVAHIAFGAQWAGNTAAEQSCSRIRQSFAVATVFRRQNQLCTNAS